MTPEQKRAMDKGNQVRFERVAMRQRLHTGELHIVDVLQDPPWYVGNIRVFDLLERAPAPTTWGRKNIAMTHSRGTRQWTRRLNLRAALANVNLFSEVDDLCPRARAWLVAELRRLYGLEMTADDHSVLQDRPFARWERAPASDWPGCVD
jgi:hypothetical protein